MAAELGSDVPLFLHHSAARIRGRGDSVDAPAAPAPRGADHRGVLRDHDVPYTQTTFWHSYAIVFRYINRVGLGERDPFECPLVVERASI